MTQVIKQPECRDGVADSSSSRSGPTPMVPAKRDGRVVDHLDLELKSHPRRLAEHRLHDPPPDRPVAATSLAEIGLRDGPAGARAGRGLRAARRQILRHRSGGFARPVAEVGKRLLLEGRLELSGSLPQLVPTVGVEDEDQRRISSAAARSKPRRSAAPLPRFGLCSMTVAPAARPVRWCGPRTVVATRTGRCAASPRRPARSAALRCSPDQGHEAGRNRKSLLDGLDTVVSEPSSSDQLRR